MVNMTLAVTAAIITESTLSFLGFGVQPPQTSWGQMLSDAEGYVVVNLLVDVAYSLLNPRIRVSGASNQ
jgi:ABC-type dipeptide/oligopeptide/nickel transport system permease subunit